MWYKRSANNVLATRNPCGRLTRACSVPGSVRHAPRRHSIRSTARTAALSCSRRLSVCAWSRRSPGTVWPTNAHRGRFGTRSLTPADLRSRAPMDTNLADELLLGRDPVSGAALASQPTISRFENGASRPALYRMGRELAACVIERHRRCTGGCGVSPSIWRPTTRRTAPSSSRSSMGTMAAGVSCRCSHS